MIVPPTSDAFPVTYLQTPSTDRRLDRNLSHNLHFQISIKTNTFIPIKITHFQKTGGRGGHSLANILVPGSVGPAF